MSRRSSNPAERSSILRSPEERKEILRKIITKTECLQDTISDHTIQALESFMEETDIINSETTIEEKIHNQEEVLLDSKVMNISSRVLKHCTRSLKKFVCSYDQIEFAQKLVQYVQHIPNVETEAPDWSLLESEVAKCFKRTANYSTLLGTLAPLERKEINRRKPQGKDAQAQVKKPENVVELEKEEEGLELTVRINKLISRYYKINRKPLDFFKFVLNPYDFGKTIQNILQISFLVRDGKVKIAKDSSGVLVIHPCSKEIQSTVEKTLNVQNVMYLNMEQWRTLKGIYRLERPMIEFDGSTFVK